MQASSPRLLPGILLPLLCLTAASTSPARDLWIEPSSYRPAVGSSVGLSLRAGDNFSGEPVRRQPERIERFVLVGPAGVQAATGNEGDDPAGFARIVAPGAYVAGFRGHEEPVEIESAEFEAYLTEAGLEAISKLRAERGESSRPGRTTRTQCAKSILEAGSVGAGFDHALGFPFEIVPGRNPYAFRGGGEMPVLVLRSGVPTEGARVVVLRKGDPAFRLSARTGGDGRVVFRLSKPGVYLVKSVYMAAAEPDADADWESFLASLTFRVPESK